MNSYYNYALTKKRKTAKKPHVNYELKKELV
jgi:hypothetical protein